MIALSSFRVRLAGSFLLVISAITFINLAVKIDTVSAQDVLGLGLAFGFGTALALFLAWRIERSQMAGVRKIEAAVLKLSEGAFEADVPCCDNKDEMGKLAQAVEQWRQNAMLCKSEMTDLAACSSRQKEKIQQIEHLLVAFDDLTSQAVAEMGDGISALEDSAATVSMVAELSSGRTGLITDLSCTASKNILQLAILAEELKEEIPLPASSKTPHQKRATHAILECAKNASQQVEKIFQGAGELRSLALETEEASLNLTIRATTLTGRTQRLRQSLQELLNSASVITVERSGEFLAWHDDYLTGNGLIDRDHKVLVTYMNDLHQAMYKGLGSERVESILAGLAHFSKEHFGRENQMAGRKLAETDQGCRHEQEEFAAKIKSLQLGLTRRRGMICVQTLESLKGGLESHIRVTSSQQGDASKGAGIAA
ncbi:MAG: HAMP domain-containing protein [Alphaproteobacteria bacterium]|nr:HAMP domain-containing protein [Alphaproteobacteria bacterium]